MMKELDLTDAQREQIKELREAKKAEKETFREQMKTLKENKQALILNYSEEQANAHADEVATIARQKVLARIDMHKQVYEILDDEQKEKYLTLLKEKGEKRSKGWFKGRGFGNRDDDRHCD